MESIGNQGGLVLSPFGSSTYISTKEAGLSLVPKYIGRTINILPWDPQSQVSWEGKKEKEVSRTASRGLVPIFEVSR